MKRGSLVWAAAALLAVAAPPAYAQWGVNPYCYVDNVGIDGESLSAASPAFTTTAAPCCNLTDAHLLATETWDCPGGSLGGNQYCQLCAYTHLDRYVNGSWASWVDSNVSWTNTPACGSTDNSFTWTVDFTGLAGGTGTGYFATAYYKAMSSTADCQDKSTGYAAFAYKGFTLP